MTLGRLLGLWASVHAGKQGWGVARGHCKSSEPQLLFLSRSLGVSEMSPRQEPVTQAWWSRAGLGGGGGMRKHGRGKVCSLGPGGQRRDPDWQLLPLPAAGTGPQVEGRALPTGLGQCAERPQP